jgi:hypothetical protein
VRRPKGKRPLGIPRRRWEDDNNKINSKMWDGTTWTGLVWFRIGTGAGRL